MRGSCISFPNAPVRGPSLANASVWLFIISWSLEVPETKGAWRCPVLHFLRFPGGNEVCQLHSETFPMQLEPVAAAHFLGVVRNLRLYLLFYSCWGVGLCWERLSGAYGRDGARMPLPRPPSRTLLACPTGPALCGPSGGTGLASSLPRPTVLDGAVSTSLGQAPAPWLVGTLVQEGGGGVRRERVRGRGRRTRRRKRCARS